MEREFHFVALIYTVSLLFICNCYGSTWTVGDDGTADFTNIQEAIEYASNGDFIQVQEGVYFEAINFLGKAIVVEGAAASNTIIDGSRSTSAVVTFDSGETSQSALSKLTIRGGQGNFWVDPIFGQQRCGGGIYCEQSSPMIQLCVISDNSAWGGAGIFVTEGEPQILFNDIVHNEAVGHGGGMYFSGGVNAIVDSCDVTNNVAEWGGGMTCTEWSDATILNSSFNQNTTRNVGGGIFIRSNSSPVLFSCTFDDNIQISNPLGSGGGACIYGGGDTGGPCYPAFTDCTFIGNSVIGDGGGMSAAYSSHPKLTNCSFSQNFAGRSGGGLACVADAGHVYPSNADVQYCTFESNIATEEGGGIHVRNSDPTFLNVQVHSNVAGTTGGGMNFFKSPAAELIVSTICSNFPNQINGSYTDGGGNSVSGSCTQCIGDVDGDGQVNVTDLLAVVGVWGLCDGCPADLDGSGVVDVTDLLTVVGNWGLCK